VAGALRGGRAVLTLAFDTATAWGRFALAEDGRLLAEQPHNVTGSYADALLPVIERLLAAGGRRLDQVDTVAVTCGPGSFTGVRIGLASAKGLAWALGARLLPVPTLAAMAAALLAEWPDRELAVPVLDARRGEVFAAVYRRRDGWVEPVVPPAALAPDAWWERVLAAAAEPAAAVWGGNGVALVVGEGPRLRPGLAARGAPEVRPWSAAHPATARAMALAAGDPTAGLAEVHPFLAVPLYLRASEAEVRRRLDLTPEAPDFATAIAGGGLALRSPRAADLPDVERIERESFGDPWPRASLREELRSDALRCPLVAEREGRVVGYLMAWRAGDELHVLNLAVAAAERRRGTGSRLLAAALAAAGAAGLGAATLEVRVGNAGARMFYARHDFVESGRRPRYYRDNGEDALILTRPLAGGATPGEA